MTPAPHPDRGVIMQAQVAELQEKCKTLDEQATENVQCYSAEAQRRERAEHDLKNSTTALGAYSEENEQFRAQIAEQAAQLEALTQERDELQQNADYVVSVRQELQETNARNNELTAQINALQWGKLACASDMPVKYFCTPCLRANVIDTDSVHLHRRRHQCVARV